MFAIYFILFYLLKTIYPIRSFQRKSLAWDSKQKRKIVSKYDL